MRIHFFPPTCGFLREQPAAHRGHRGSSCHLQPCEIGQKNSPDAAPYLPTLLDFCTDQSFTVWQGHLLPSPAAQPLGKWLCPGVHAPSVECSAQPGEVSISQGGPRAQGLVLHLEMLQEPETPVACCWREGTASLCSGKLPLSNPPELSEGASMPN